MMTHCNVWQVDSGYEKSNILFTWTSLRVRVNNGLSHDIINQTYHDIDTSGGEGSVELLLRRPGVYKYGLADDCSTSLHEEDFINFGMPRAQYNGLHSIEPHLPRTDYY